ncbi:MAG TPA: discoidin domain-containing protein, partial [bacterium]|nr:discoidin domain-containing protein [bacterium]
PGSYYKSTKHFIDMKIEGNSAFRKKVTAEPLPSKKYSNGDLSKLTNGVQGASDYKVHWLGWEAKDFSVTVDLGESQSHSKIAINSLYDSKSWILHPKKVTCFVSSTGKEFHKLNSIEVQGNQRKEERIRTYQFDPQSRKFRYVKFDIKGTLSLPNWHTSAGGDSWIFIDEIIVE